MSGPAVNPARFGPRQAQPLEGFAADAKSILAGLFSGPQASDMPPMARAAMEQNERIKGLASRLLGSTEGEELMEALCDVTLRRPTFITQMGVDPMQAYAYGAFREGQAAVIYLLLGWIAEGRSEQQPTREGAIHASRTKRPKRAKPARQRKR